MKIEFFNLTDRKMHSVKLTLDESLSWLYNNCDDGNTITAIRFYESDISPCDLTHRDEVELPMNLIKLIAEVTKVQHMSASFPHGCGFTKADGDRKLSILMLVESR